MSNKIVEFTKEEIHAVLQLATKFHNEHIKLPFSAEEIPAAIHKTLSAAYAELQEARKTTTVAFGHLLRAFANEHAPVVADAVATPVVEEKPVEKAKKAKPEPAPVAEPEKVEEPAPEAPVEKAEEPKAE